MTDTVCADRPGGPNNRDGTARDARFTGGPCDGELYRYCRRHLAAEGCQAMADDYIRWQAENGLDYTKQIADAIALRDEAFNGAGECSGKKLTRCSRHLLKRWSAHLNYSKKCDEIDAANAERRADPAR